MAWRFVAAFVLGWLLGLSDTWPVLADPALPESLNRTVATASGTTAPVPVSTPHIVVLSAYHRQ